MARMSVLAVVWGLSLLSTECWGVDSTCIDHLTFGLTCQDMTSAFCDKPEAKTICPKYCGLCEYSCNFENQTLCTWTNENNPVTLDWRLDSAATGNAAGGPQRDHTTHSGQGFYLLTSSDAHAVIPEAVLESETLPHQKHYCLNFFYFFDSGSLGEVFVQRKVSGVRAEVLSVVKAEEVGRGHWHELSVDVPPYIVDYSLLIVADTDSLSGAPIALDDVTLTPGTCSTPATTTVATTTVGLTCPRHWTLFEESCYWTDTHHVTAAEAKGKCEHEHASLVEIQSSDETRFLNDFAHHHSTGDFWIGLEKIALEGAWVWMTNHQDPVYTHWQSGHPPPDGDAQYCMRFDVGDDGRWHDKECDAHYSTVCEKPASQG